MSGAPSIAKNPLNHPIPLWIKALLVLLITIHSTVTNQWENNPLEIFRSNESRC